MKIERLALLLGIFLVFSCGTSKPAVEPINTNEQSVNTFRGYDWGTPMSVVMEKEGKPDHTYKNNTSVIIFTYADRDSFYTDFDHVNTMPKTDEIQYKGITDKDILERKEYYEQKGLWDWKHIQVAGYNVGDMGFYFYQNKLIAGYYYIDKTAYNDKKSIKEIHTDLLRKMTTLYGEPETFTWGDEDHHYHNSVWKNIDLMFSRYDYEEAWESIHINYSSYDYFIKQYKQVIADQQNDTTGL